MTTLARRRAFFLSTFALTALLLAFPLASASAATSNGIDTPAGVASLPLAVEGTAVITLTPGVAAVAGSLEVFNGANAATLGVAGSCGIMGLSFGASLGSCGSFPSLMADGSNDLIFNVPTGDSYSFRINNAASPDALHIASSGVGIQTTNPAYPLDINGIAHTTAQFISTAGGAEFRGIAGNYGWMNYSDGANFYFLLTNAGNQYGTYNNLRPYNINLATGAMSIGNSLTVANGLTVDNVTIPGNVTVGGTVTVNGSTLTSSTVNVANALLTPTCGSNEALTENSNHTFACVTIANLAQIGPATVPNCAGMSPAQALTWNGTGFSCVATAVTPPASLWTALSGNIYNTSLGGNVGINVSNPIVALDLNGVAHIAGNGAAAMTIQGAYINWNRLTGGTGETDFVNNEGGGTGGFAFMLANSGGAVTLTPMFINGSGNVGIGNTTPQTTLDVNGPVRPGLVVAGAACTNQVGAIGHDANGTLLTCGSTSVWGAATPASGGMTGWVVLDPPTGTGICSSVASNGNGSICVTSTTPTQACVNAGYSDFTGNCKAVDNSGRAVQGGLVAWESNAPNWQMACNCTLGGFCEGAWGLTIQCTH